MNTRNNDRNTRNLFLVVSPALAWLVTLGGCQSDKHTMTDSGEGKSIVCRLCYDEIQVVRSEFDENPGPTTIIKKHQCADCNTEMSIYNENGVLMVKCANCAPEGMSCDRCLPPSTMK